MSRLASLAPLVATVLCVAPACGEADPLAERPGAHLVLVSIDTLRADHLGCYGYERDTSPVLDALAAESLLFEQVTATASSTAPSHMSMFSGVLPWVHGILNEVPFNQSPNVRLLAEVLADQGYRTVAFADGGHVSEVAGFDRGFERFDSRYEWFDHKLDRVEQWLSEAGDEPTFLFVHTYGVHAPYIPGREHDRFTDPDYQGRLAGRAFVLERRLRERRVDDLALATGAFWEGRPELDEADVRHLVDLYDGAIARVDAGLGRLLGLLEAQGWLDDAWLVVTSDHGEAFREHGSFEHRQVNQEELRVPLLVRPPGGLASGRRLPWPVSQLDLQPTLLRALGLPGEPGVQGRALWPLDAPVDRPQFAAGGERLCFDTVLVGPTKLVENLGEPWRLYDLAADPAERRDLSRLDPPPAWRQTLERVLAEAREASAALRSAVGDPQQGPELDDEQRAELEALGYLR